MTLDEIFEEIDICSEIKNKFLARLTPEDIALMGGTIEIDRQFQDVSNNPSAITFFCKRVSNSGIKSNLFEVWYDEKSLPNQARQNVVAFVEKKMYEMFLVQRQGTKQAQVMADAYMVSLKDTLLNRYGVQLKQETDQPSQTTFARAQRSGTVFNNLTIKTKVWCAVYLDWRTGSDIRLGFEAEVSVDSLPAAAPSVVIGLEGNDIHLDYLRQQVQPIFDGIFTP